MTLLQAVFSMHSIMCFFYGCSTFFHPEVTVELGLALTSYYYFGSIARTDAVRASEARGTSQCDWFFSGLMNTQTGAADRDWLRRENTVLLQLHGACVLGLGLVAISAAQFEYADPRNLIAKCMLGLHILLSYAMLQDWKPGGQTQTPVMVATAIMSVLYSICCSLFPDKDVPERARSSHDKKSS